MVGGKLRPMACLKSAADPVSFWSRPCGASVANATVERCFNHWEQRWHAGCACCGFAPVFAEETGIVGEGFKRMGTIFFAVILGYALLTSALMPTIKAGASLLCALLGLLAAAYGLVIICGFYAAAAYGLMFGGLIALVGTAGYLLVARRKTLVAFFTSPSVTV